MAKKKEDKKLTKDQAEKKILSLKETESKLKKIKKGHQCISSLESFQRATHFYYRSQTTRRFLANLSSLNPSFFSEQKIVKSYKKSDIL